jgi:hypothetical protein
VTITTHFRSPPLTEVNPPLPPKAHSGFKPSSFQAVQLSRNRFVVWPRSILRSDTCRMSAGAAVFPAVPLCQACCSSRRTIFSHNFGRLFTRLIRPSLAPRQPFRSNAHSRRSSQKHELSRLFDPYIAFLLPPRCKCFPNGIESCLVVRQRQRWGLSITIRDAFK